MSTASHPARTPALSSSPAVVAWLPVCPPTVLYPSLFESLLITLRNSRSAFARGDDPRALATLGRETGARC